ncbi:adenylate/guanylate cyclase domain-containing protein [Loktanella sp. IMCC34160]|uniref:ATP-binding protein n=1 Tax=Loktanella sp. IMCC34160 TaxID=2510646 RepID=UPI0013EDB355|nr:adenylate/guanylate cyclase domain-containing protein [Loktanella sp. IMCC34160]
MTGTREKPKEATGERRQITVVFVDIVGFSQLANSTDAEDLQGWLEAYYDRTRDIVETRGGTVTEYLGDGVVACFGLHSADELAAPRAVDAAIAAVAPLAPPPGGHAPVILRAGVATGEVATRPEQDTTGRPAATGVVTTLASRIQEKGSPGDVLIAEETRALLRDGFHIESLPPQTLKGFAEARPVYRAGPKRQPHKWSRKADFVGRTEQLSLLRGADRPSLIRGEAGIGKTALTRAIGTEATRTCIIGGDGLHLNSSHFPFRQWLRESLEDAGATYAGIEKTFPTLSDEARQALALILGLPEGQRLLLEKANTALKSLIEQSLWQAVRSSLPITGGMIIVEDLHWLDNASFGVLQAFLSAPDADRIRIILTSRDDPKLEQFLDLTGLQLVPLSPLSETEARQLLAVLSGGKIDSDTADHLIDTAGGVPLFLEQLFKRGTAATDTGVPATLTDLLAERIDNTGPARGLLQSAAIIGRRFRSDVLGLLEADTGDMAARLDAAAELGVIDRIGPDEWMFSHALLHQAAYHGILRRTREGLHARLASVLGEHFPEIAAQDPAMIAEHHARARAFVPAILGFLQASQVALLQGAMADAQAHTETALDLCRTAPPDLDTTDLEIACQTSLGSVLMQMQGFAAAPVRDAFESVLNIARASGRPSHNSAPALFGSFSHAIIAGDMDRSESFCDLLEEVAEGRSNETDMSEVQLASLAAKNCKCFYAGDFSEQFTHIAVIRDLYDLSRHGVMITRYGMDIFAAAQMFEPVARAICGTPEVVPALIEETDRHQDLLNIPVMRPYALIWGAVPLFYIGETEKALARLQQGIAEADAQGAMFWQIVGRVWLGIMDEAQQDSAEGRAAMKAQMDTLDMIGSGIGASYFSAVYAQALSRAGDTETACSMSRKAAKECAASRLLCWYPEILRLHARNCDAAGLADEAAETRETGLTAARAQGAVLWEQRLLADREGAAR